VRRADMSYQNERCSASRRPAEVRANTGGQLEPRPALRAQRQAYQK